MNETKKQTCMGKSVFPDPNMILVGKLQSNFCDFVMIYCKVEYICSKFFVKLFFKILFMRVRCITYREI